MQSLAALVPMETSIMAETLTSADEVMSTIDTVQAIYPSGLDDFTVRMSVNDARNLVELLKLAVATRMGESARECLSEVLSRLAKAYPQVRSPYQDSMKLCLCMYLSFLFGRCPYFSKSQKKSASVVSFLDFAVSMNSVNKM